MSDQATYDTTIPDYSEFCQLWMLSGWPKIDESTYVSALSNSILVVHARVSGRLIGFGRLIGDGAIYAYLQDLIVHPEFRRRGIGAKIVSELTKSARDKRLQFVGLFSTMEFVDFYSTLGFTTLDNKNQGMGIYFQTEAATKRPLSVARKWK